MRKSLPILLSGLLASPLMAAPPVRPQDMPVQEQLLLQDVLIPAEGEELERRILLLSEGVPLDAHGMQAMERQRATDMTVHLNRVIELQRGPGTSGPIFIQSTGPEPVTHALTMEKSAFLGVTTSPVSPTIQQQLNLPKGVGLVVDYVEKGSPAEAAGLKVHDVLEKLDDQMLVNPQQLAVLVRMKKAGEAVGITAIHGGQRANLTAKLIEKEMPALDGMPETRFFINPSVTPVQPFTYTIPGMGGTVSNPHTTGISMHVDADGTQSRSLMDNQHDISITTDAQGKSELVVKDREGTVIYKGSAQEATLPAEIEAKVRQLKTHQNTITIRNESGGIAGGGVVESSSMNLTRRDGEHEIVIRAENGRRTLMVNQVKGNVVLYNGDYASDADLKKLPEEVAGKVKDLASKANVTNEPLNRTTDTPRALEAGAQKK